MKKNTLKIITMILLVVVAASILMVISSYVATGTSAITLNEFKELIANKSISSVQIYGYNAEIISKHFDTGVVKSVILPNNMEEWINFLIHNNINVSIVSKASKINTTELLISILSSVLSIAAYFFFLKFLLGGGGIVKQNFKFIKSNVSFNDIAGMETEKREVLEFIDFLKNKNKYKALECLSPKGLLLSGTPGNGKTFIAKAIAGEAGVNFVTASAASFIEIFVGTGPKAIRELFEAARKNAPCVVFLDEFDSLGSRNDRETHSEGKKTINQFLAEMDGVLSNEGILVVAATNDYAVIDPAALRSGRFDRHIVVSNPDYYERLLVLQNSMKRVAADHSVNIDILAKNTRGLSRADLVNLINESKILAVRYKRLFVTDQDLKEAFDRITFGTPGKNRFIDQELRNTTYHECGHTFLQYFYKNVLPKIYKVTIIPYSKSLGFLMPENNDQKSISKAAIEAKIQVCLGGRLCEEIFFGLEKVTTGCSSDLNQARNLAEEYVKFGMSEDYGFTFINNKQNLFDAKENEKFREAVDKLIKSMENISREILTKNKDKIEKLAERLLESETLTGKEVEEILEDKIQLPSIFNIKPSISFGVLSPINI